MTRFVLCWDIALPRVSCVRQEAENEERKPPEKRGCPRMLWGFQHYPVDLYEQALDKKERSKKEMEKISIICLFIAT